LTGAYIHCTDCPRHSLTDTDEAAGEEMSEAGRLYKAVAVTAP